MPATLHELSKEAVKMLGGKDLKPVKSLSDATKFHEFNILQKNPQSWFWEPREDIPTGFSLLKILEPGVSDPETVESVPVPIRDTVVQKVNADVGVKIGVEGHVSGEFAQSSGYDIMVRGISIPEPNLESLQNRRLKDPEPTFLKNCRINGDNLYVVTEAFELIKDTTLEDSSSVGFRGKLTIPYSNKGQVQGEWQKERKRTMTVPKGTVVAYRRKQLVIKNKSCAILLSTNAKRKTFEDVRKQSLCRTLVLTSDLMRCEAAELSIGLLVILFLGKVEEPFHQDFKCLEKEVSEQTRLLAELSKDVQDVVFYSILPMLGDREALYDLMDMLELDQLGHMDGPGGAILDKLRQDSRPLLVNPKKLFLYLLQALAVLSDIQLYLLAQSMEKRILLQQRELVKSILQPNFKYPWSIPFTLQPELLAPLQGEGLAITYSLLEECGLKMELNNPRSTWDLEAKMPMSALYGTLSLLQQLAEA
ncbi:gasdermin-C [Nannospalax galili]|uniref:gasdermin-C n=1 Tax=Nannospalax galili TaxID=1026970 RepID=UPI0004ED43F8|nr:gasdermin-C [Nannospalax galili]